MGGPRLVVLLPLRDSGQAAARDVGLGVNGTVLRGDTDTSLFGPLPGWYALSVNEIYGQSQRYRYFLNFRPVAMAGYSIYIYHITLDEANRVRRESGLKELASSDSNENAAGNGSKE